MDATQLTVEMWPIDKVQPYDRNARIIPQAAVDMVAESLEKFGIQQPFVVDEAGVLVVGHTRLQAAKQLGITEVPVHVMVGKTPQQIKAYRLMDNRSNQDTLWDTGKLRTELARLSEIDGMDASSTGFSDAEFNAFAANVDVGRFKDPPKTFKEFDSGLATDIKCPHCGYEWKKGQGTKTIPPAESVDDSE